MKTIENIFFSKEMLTLSILMLCFLINSSIGRLNNVNLAPITFSKRALLMFWLQSIPSIRDSTNTCADGIDDKMCFTFSAVSFNLTIVRRLSRGSNFHLAKNSPAKYSLSACVNIFPPKCDKWWLSMTLYNPFCTDIMVRSDVSPPNRTISTFDDSVGSTPISYASNAADGSVMTPITSNPPSRTALQNCCRLFWDQFIGTATTTSNSDSDSAAA